MASTKVKILLLFLILAGSILVQGCIDAGVHAVSSKASENLYKSIFYPYSELSNHRGAEVSETRVQEARPDDFSNRSRHEHVTNLRHATLLLDNNIKNAELISVRLEEGIQHYKAEGKGVSKLEALLNEYNLHIEEAKKYRALADSAVADEKNNSIENSDLENYSSENIRREYLINAQKSMIQANLVLKEIFTEFQRLMPGSEEISVTSRLSAEGDGKASLIGNFTLFLHLEKGALAITDLSPDLMINSTGDYVYEKNTDMQGNVLILYHIFNADMQISASPKTVLLSGSNITLTAAGGEGYVLFQGNGTYVIEETDGKIKEQKWANPFPKTTKSGSKFD